MLRNIPITQSKKFVLFFFSVILFSLTTIDAGHSQDPAGAPKVRYWVVDQAGILSSSIEQQLTNNAKAHEKNTSNQVVVVVLKTLDGWTIERYGRWLGNKWGIGQRTKNNGVLMLVAPNERKVRIEVGLGLESILTNSLAKSIIDNEIIPSFKNNKMQQGVVMGHQAIIQALGGEYTDKGWWKKLWQLILLPFFVFGRIFGFGGGSFSGGGGSFGGGGASGSW